MIILFQDCRIETNILMHCLVPPMDIPQVFKHWDARIESITETLNLILGRKFSSVSSSVTMRDVQVKSDLSIVDGHQSLVFDIAIKLDGIRYFTDIRHQQELRGQARMIYFDTTPNITGQELGVLSPFHQDRLTIKVRFCICLRILRS